MKAQFSAGANVAIWRRTTYHWYLLAGAPVFLLMFRGATVTARPFTPP